MKDDATYQVLEVVPISMTPCEPGWKAVYANGAEKLFELPVVSWCLYRARYNEFWKENYRLLRRHQWDHGVCAVIQGECGLELTAKEDYGGRESSFIGYRAPSQTAAEFLSLFDNDAKLAEYSADLAKEEAERDRPEDPF